VLLSRDLDLYVLAIAALVFALLGAVEIAHPTVTSSAILGVLTFLAVAQIRSRRQVSEIAEASRMAPTDILRRDFPPDLLDRRHHARTLLLIGISHYRTIPTSHRRLRDSLSAGAQVRVLLLDPDDECALHVAASSSPDFIDAEVLRDRIQTSLRYLEQLRAGADGRLEVRVTNAVPRMGVNAIDLDHDNALIVVQHYEFRPSDEPAPILRLDVNDGPWFQRFAAEANRMWEYGRPWSTPSSCPTPKAPNEDDKG
jgi:hypothetical protein